MSMADIMSNAMTASLAFCPMDTAPKNVPVILVSAWGQKAVSIWDEDCWRYGPSPGDTWDADYPRAWVPVHACGWIPTSARSTGEAPSSADAVTKMVDRARGYLAMNAAESGADVLIDELASLLIALREALRDLLAVTDPAGMTEEIMADKEKMARFLEDCERDTKAAVSRARAALTGSEPSTGGDQ